MKALCISDIHGRLAFLSAVENYLGENPPDLILCCGDITNNGREVELCEKFIAIVRKLPFFFVPGNNEQGEIYDLFIEFSVEGKLREFKGEKIVGIGGIPDLYGHGIYPAKIPVKEMENSIFLSHIPPRNIETIKKFDWTPEKSLDLKLSGAPKIQISGHQHNNWGVGWIGKTKILKLPAGTDMMVAELDTESLAIEFIGLRKYDRINLEVIS
ncbi:MAG: metallophosphoesterase [Candidatus Berkelbacteria bacterium]|nr:metallophosphoesterase [Candidatus Berkelbacteria bacterium]